MFVDKVNARYLAMLARPDIRLVLGQRPVVFDRALPVPFRVSAYGKIIVGAAALDAPRVGAFYLRHAIELAILLDITAAATRCGGLPSDRQMMLAGFCAARVAARFWLLDGDPPGQSSTCGPPDWIATMAASTPPAPDVFARIWGILEPLQEARDLPAERPGPIPVAVVAAVSACWPWLGPVEALMAEGGDVRLAVDRHTGVNRYGCSPRLRPWAVTFASSTASALSERGFVRAETARQRLLAACLKGDPAEALRAESERVRADIAAHYALPATARVVLAASGTDAELIALAVAALPDPQAAISTILVAPEETGTGVPLAAAGRHFADTSAMGRSVAKGDLVEGMPETRVLTVKVRDADGGVLLPASIDAACVRLVEQEAAAGRRVILHRLDVSKTGLLAPGLDVIARLQTRFGNQLVIVVDACQARLDRCHVQDYLARGWLVMLTGSKFFTGPPFSGALLLPPALAARLRGPARLPAGLRQYCGRMDWPQDAQAAEPFGDCGNVGLVLRWHAALAEMAAFAAIPEPIVLERARAAIQVLDAAIAESPHCVAVPASAPQRPGAVGWASLQTIRCFLVLAPVGGAVDGVALDIVAAGYLYRWLNSDVVRALPLGSTDRERRLAALLCHIGQPVPMAHKALPSGVAGAFRVSVDARLLAGAPSQGDAAWSPSEMACIQGVLDKVALLLRYWPRMMQFDPAPRFAPEAKLYSDIGSGAALAI